jgi:hypothetical protein
MSKVMQLLIDVSGMSCHELSDRTAKLYELALLTKAAIDG